MRYYETLFLLNPNLADEDYKALVDKFLGLVEKHKGVLINVDEWGKKPLAYDVKKFNRGYYVLMRYCGGSQIVSELNREFRLDERVLKYQSVKLSDQADPEALKREADKAGGEAREEEEKPAAGGDSEQTMEGREAGESENGGGKDIS